MKQSLLGLIVMLGLVAFVPGDTSQNPRATLVTSKGTIVLELFPAVAPKTVQRIATLANQGFYRNIVFHRVVPQFVIQGGDPTGTGDGGSGVTIPAEFSNLHYLRGSLGMARDDNPDSADSQFFICLSPQPHLNQKYTLFGQVIAGDEVLDLIVQGDRILDMQVTWPHSGQ